MEDSTKTIVKSIFFIFFIFLVFMAIFGEGMSFLPFRYAYVGGADDRSPFVNYG